MRKIGILHRFVSFFLVITLFMQMVPAAGLADKIYTANFTALGKDPDEDFRKWAYELVKYYRDEYACVDDENVFELNTKWNEYYYYFTGDFWLREAGKFDDAAVYHPYYRLADRKQAYDLSKNIYGNMGGAKNLYNNSAGTIAYRETFLNEDERNDLYMWMLKETLSEKAATDASFKMLSTDRKYAFTVKEGKLVADSQLTGTIKHKERETLQKVTDYAIDALDLGVQVYLEKKRVEDNAKKMVTDAVETAVSDAMVLSNSKNYFEKWRKNFITKMQDELVNQIFGALRDINTLISENEKKQILAEMRNAMAVELAEEAANINNNAIKYMKNTYISSRSMNLGEVSEYEKAATKIIDTLESDEVTELIADYSMDEVKAKISDTVLSEYEQFMDSILSEEELATAIARNVVGHIISLVEALLKNAVTEGMKQLQSFLSDKIKDNASGWSQLEAVLKELVQFVDTDIIQNVIIARVFAALKAVKLENYIIQDPNGKKEDDLLEALGKAFQDQFEGNVKKKITPIATELQQKFWDFLIKEVMYLLMGNQYKQQEEDEKNKKISSFTSAFRDNSPVSVIAISLIRGLLSGVKSAIDNETENSINQGKTAHLSKESIMKYDQISQLVDNALSGWSKVASDKEMDVTHRSDAIAQTVEAIIAVVQWYSGMDEESRGYIWDAIMNGLSADVLEEGISQIAKDTNLTDIIFQLLFGQNTEKDVKDDAKEITKKYQEGEYGEYYSYESAVETIKKKVEEKIDGGKQVIEEGVTIIQKVWDKCLAVADSVTAASMSMLTLLTGEDPASLSAERARKVANESRKIENAVLANTYKSRMELLNYDASRIGEVFEKGNDVNKYVMSAEDILDPKITPDIEHIKALTDMILLQMHLDTVGMGALITVVAQRYNYYYTQLYSQYLGSANYKTFEDVNTETYDPESVLLSEETVEKLYNEIVTRIDDFERRRPKM